MRAKYRIVVRAVKFESIGAPCAHHRKLSATSRKARRMSGGAPPGPRANKFCFCPGASVVAMPIAEYAEE